MRAISIIENEIEEYLTGQVQISDGYWFSQHRLVKRIMIYANSVYPDGKIDSQGNYKYWFDINGPRIDAEVKNIDFDTKDVFLFSDRPKDSTPLFIANARLRDWLKETGEATEINDSVEEGSGWGNVVWKKTKDGHFKVDLKNFYVINQTAKSLDDTPAIERQELTQSDLREKKDVWKNVDNVIEKAGRKQFRSMLDQNYKADERKETLYYEIFERNGEISEKDLFEAQKKEGGDENKYILAKIIVTGIGPQPDSTDKSNEKFILFAEELKEMPYKEYHRGRYEGRWMRKGIFEILFDIQTRANEIGNQIARGLEWASKTIFQTPDKLIAQNVITDMLNGHIVKTQSLSQVQTRMEGFDQLIADWNRLMKEADRLTNAFEIIQGETQPSGTPFRLGAILNINANKLYNFIREKLGLVYEKIFEEWIIPELIKDLKTKDILRIANDEEFLKRYYGAVANSWYLRNLLSIGPHTREEAEALKQNKIKELQERPQALIKYSREMFKDFKPRAKVVITGENVRIRTELESLRTFIALETDPVRRTALVEKAMRLTGIDAESLPKSTPEQMTGRRVPQEQPQPTLEEAVT